MSTRETKHFLIKGRKYDHESGIFEGYAAVFGNVDTDGDIIEKGAFSKFLAGDWSRVKILALHNDEWLPIGKPLELHEDDVGLYIKAQISDTAMGRDVRALLRDGVLDEMSIGYIAHDFYIGSDSIRHLTELEIFEVSVVTWAANEKAKVLDVKARLSKAVQNPENLLALADLLEQAASDIRAQSAKADSEENPAKSDHYKIGQELKSRSTRKRRNRAAIYKNK